MTLPQVPPRALTVGPKYHWFGYYDKCQFDPTGRYVLGMEVDFEHRSPTPDDFLKVGIIDLQDGARWVELGHSHAWCWQQGCMLQWRPGADAEIIWNDRQDGQFVCHILAIHSGKKQTLPFPIYTISPDGNTAFSIDFSRLNDMRPGYGYAGLDDLNGHNLAPGQSGIWRLDLESESRELIVSLADIAKLPYPHADLSAAKHYFNHLLVNPTGTRLEFLHRWRLENKPGRGTRMLTCAPDGSDIRIVDDCGLTSHFIWYDVEHLLAWTLAHSRRGDFCLFNERTGISKPIGSELMPQDGHINCLPQAEWLINDTYPNQEKIRSLYLYHVAKNQRIDIGAFLSPQEYEGEWRCDLHPRLSPDGKRVVIDSAHAGNGRQMYLIDISDVVGMPP